MRACPASLLPCPLAGNFAVVPPRGPGSLGPARQPLLPGWVGSAFTALEGPPSSTGPAKVSPPLHGDLSWTPISVASGACGGLVVWPRCGLWRPSCLLLLTGDTLRPGRPWIWSQSYSPQSTLQTCCSGWEKCLLRRSREFGLGACTSSVVDVASCSAISS